MSKDSQIILPYQDAPKIVLPYQDTSNLLFDKDFYKDYGIFVKPINYPLSTRKIESLLEIAKMQKYFQCNPVKFIDIMFSMELLDAQALIIQESWFVENTLACCTRGLGKSTIIDLSLMSKGMLFNNYWTYIASGTGSQAENTFTTLEKLANDNIDTFSGSTGRIFKDEVEIKNASGDGFSHGSNGFSYSLYNGAMTKTLNGNIDAKRGFRGSVVFDECGFLSDEMINVYSAFAAVNKNLKTGKDESGRSIDPIRQRCFPSDMPYQKIYISSASSTDTKFYRLYREFMMKRIIGDPNYCILHIDCGLAFKPTLRGEVIRPLLSKSTVASEMRTNPEKARREYYCLFTTEAGSDAIIKRGVITRNEEARKPLLYNDTGHKKFVIAYDPARSRDNSIILVCELYEETLPNGAVDKKLRIVNCIKLMDVFKKNKTPMETPDQIEYLKKVILEYDGGTDNYDNIIGVYVDAGSGGGGVNICDFLKPDWVDAAGNKHRGLIDKENEAEYLDKYPYAVDKIRLIQPGKYKSDMYEALIDLMNQNKIKFTQTYDGKDYLTFFDTEKVAKKKAAIRKRLEKENIPEDEFEDRFEQECDSIQVETKSEKLDWADKLALSNIDALKEELVNMIRVKNKTRKDSFELTPEKANIMHDDRAYTLALAAWCLSLQRKTEFIERTKVKKDNTKTKNMFTIRAPKRNTRF